MINQNESITRRLLEIERDENVILLYACESGSRAWGFASPDSDFDIRFIYKRPIHGYLVIRDFPDTLEYPLNNNLDFSGWDLKKFLLHLNKSNGVMFEWLQSPVVYLNRDGFRESSLELMPRFFNPRLTINHYLGLTKRTLFDLGDSSHVKLKKYFYILRPLMAARWIYRKKTIPPMEFESLLGASDFDASIVSMIAELKREKELSSEARLIPRLTDLESFVISEIERYEADLPAGSNSGGTASELNDLFFESIMGER
jgi:uncharacterized protein